MRWTGSFWLDGTRKMVPVDGHGALTGMCRTLATSYAEPDTSTFRRRLVRHASIFATEVLGMEDRPVGEWPVAEMGPRWVDVASLCAFHEKVECEIEPAARRARAAHARASVTWPRARWT